MEIFAISGGSLVWLGVGFALGTYVGVMITPIATWWLGRREWREASREVEFGPKPQKRTIVPQPQGADDSRGEPRIDREPASV